MAKTKVEAKLDQPDEQLDRAIEELRGVLHEEEKRPDARTAPGGNSNIIMNIPVDVQIILGSTEMPVSDLMALQKGSTVALNLSMWWSMAARSHAARSRCWKATRRASASG
jgi:flagellar motor switch protein FliN/FliY